MSELQDLAQRIKSTEAKKSNISERDLNKVVDKIGRVQQNTMTETAKKSAQKAVDGTISELVSKMPTAKSIKNAFLSTAPIISNLGGVLEKSNNLLTSSVKDLAESSNSSGEVNSSLEPVDNKDFDSINTETIMIKDLLEEVVEQLKYSNNLEENIIDENRRNKLASLGTDNDPTVSPTSNTDNLLEELLEGQEDANQLATLDFLTGKGGILSVLSGLLGSSGLFASSGSFVKGLKLITKNGLKFLGPVGLVAGSLFELYEGFTKADDYFGEAVSIPRKIQYAVTHLLSSLLAPVDWAIEAITGEESDLRGTFENFAIGFQDQMFSKVKPLINVVSGLLDWSINFYKEIFAGIGSDTKISELPAILYENISTYASESMDILSDKFKSGLDVAFEVLGSIPDKIMNLFSGMGDTVKALFNSTLDSITSGLGDSIGFGLGDKIAEQFDSMKFDIGDNEPPKTTTTTTYSSSSTNDPEYVRGRMADARERAKAIKDKYRKKALPVAEQASLVSKSEPLIFKDSNPSSNEDKSYGAEIVDAIEKLRADKKPSSVITSAPVTSNQSTTVVKGGMTTYSGTRKLVPENW